MKARRHYQKGALSATASALHELIRSKHDCAEAHFLLGEVHRRQGHWEEAGDSYVLATFFKPAMAEAYAQLGHVLVVRQKTAEAVVALEQAMALMPQNVEIVIMLGAALAAAGRFGEAVTLYRRAIALEPDSADAHSSLGYLLLRYFEQVGEGISHIETALALAPDHVDALCNQVVALQYRGRPREAPRARRCSHATPATSCG